MPDDPFLLKFNIKVRIYNEEKRTGVFIIHTDNYSQFRKAESALLQYGLSAMAIYDVKGCGVDVYYDSGSSASWWFIPEKNQENIMDPCN